MFTGGRTARSDDSGTIPGKPPVASINDMVAVEPRHIAYAAVLVSLRNSRRLSIVMSVFSHDLSSMPSQVGLLKTKRSRPTTFTTGSCVSST